MPRGLKENLNNNWKFRNAPPPYYGVLLSPSQNPYVLRPDEIQEVCVLLNFSVDDRSYVCRLPNSIERD